MGLRLLSCDDHVTSPAPPPFLQLHEVAALEILTVLLEDANDDTVEVAVGFLKECGAKLTEVASRAVMGVFDTLRQTLHEGKIETRTQYMIEVLQAVRKDKFKVWMRKCMLVCCLYM